MNNSRTIKMISRVLLVAVILYSGYFAILQTRSYLLNNTIEYRLGLLSSGNIGSFDDYASIRELIKRSEMVSVSNPDTWLLAGNMELKWIVNSMPNSSAELTLALNNAQQHYVTGLNLQPDNPFLWLNLANVLQHQADKKAVFEHALEQAEKYGKTQPAIIKTLTALSKSGVRRSAFGVRKEQKREEQEEQR